MKLKNENIKIGELGEERTFVNGIKNWRIEWAEIFEERFSVGNKVSYIDDEGKKFKGRIEWMIVTEQGDVEIVISNTPLGRIDLEYVEHVR